jgi:hypothetical protein
MGSAVAIVLGNSQPEIRARPLNNRDSGKGIHMTMLIAVPEGWTNEEWREKLNYLANQIHWDDESLADQDEADAEGDWS